MELLAGLTITIIILALFLVIKEVVLNSCKNPDQWPF